MHFKLIYYQHSWWYVGARWKKKPPPMMVVFSEVKEWGGLKIAKPSDKDKLEELKKKIHDEEYLSDAIKKLAQKLTEDLIDED